LSLLVYKIFLRRRSQFNFRPEKQKSGNLKLNFTLNRIISINIIHIFLVDREEQEGIAPFPSPGHDPSSKPTGHRQMPEFDSSSGI
jgi:hypothetical protein